ncbi:hypothetical protein BT67DRAFT_374319 [Trichocladium antarcticum]|uniref:Phosphoribosylaminoimidazole-succinocarboxamide synthase n=1 Tax=Trichocladium antarcticum TaxID=1450529 RepID=A0AAN6ZG05_9PEZI|nr:hypothetical protein BT67DRAFT_374319 [Trichocladium antarcticum]
MQHPNSPRRQLQTAYTPTPTPTTPPPVSPLTSTSSEPGEPEPCDLDRTFGPPAPSHGRPVVIEGPYRRVPDIPLYNPPNWDANNAVMIPDFRDELARLEGVVTPGVDNTPFIQYAIEALTRDRESGYSAVATTASSSSARPRQHPPMPPVPLPLPLPFQPPATTRVPTTRTARPESRRQQLLRPLLPTPQASAHSLADSLLKRGPGPHPVQPHEWRHLGADELLARAPPLTFRPWPLRAPALFGFMALCVLMVAALILSAVYSHLHQGLLGWATINGGRYFLFRIFPQLLAAAVLLYAQFLTATIFRILPFARLASEAREEREGAIFQDLYPSFLWPRLVGPWNVWVPILVSWLMNFTIPLQSALFTVILVDQSWTWATVQGVAWTLVALYLALLASMVIVWRYWARLESTGLIWDPRSLADVAAIVSETNTAADYQGTQLARSRDGIRFALRHRAGDRLGYWTWKDGRAGFWHTLGSPMDDANPVPAPNLSAGQRMERRDEKQTGAKVSAEGPFVATDQEPDPDHDMEASHPSAEARRRYLPWCLRTNQLLWFTLTTLGLVFAIFVASFLPATRITAGFAPGLKADPQPGAFSAANFFYSFFPSLLGLLPFLLFQSIDLHLRILQPWAALSGPSSSSSGAAASRSILADYAACAPLQSALHAARNRHWRAAAVALLATLLVLLPVLAGGMFMALTTADAGVRMFPNVPCFAALLALLVLVLLALAALLPARRALRMPHPVTCLAEVVGFLVGAAAAEETFRGCLSRGEMLEKMGVGAGESRWVFGDREGEGGLGVRRVRRFTETKKMRVRKSQIRRLRRE